MQNTVELESFDPREAHAFVLRVLPDSVPSYVTPLVAPLRYLPLSVSLAVSMLGEFEMKVIVDDFILRVRVTFWSLVWPDCQVLSLRAIDMPRCGLWIFLLRPGSREMSCLITQPGSQSGFFRVANVAEAAAAPVLNYFFFLRRLKS